MTDKIREKFERIYKVPDDTVYTADFEAYVWKKYTNTHAPFNDMWEAFQAGYATRDEDIRLLTTFLYDCVRTLAHEGCLGEWNVKIGATSSDEEEREAITACIKEKIAELSTPPKEDL